MRIKLFATLQLCSTQGGNVLDAFDVQLMKNPWCKIHLARHKLDVIYTSFNMGSLHGLFHSKKIKLHLAPVSTQLLSVFKAVMNLIRGLLQRKMTMIIFVFVSETRSVKKCFHKTSSNREIKTTIMSWLEQRDCCMEIIWVW